MACAIRWESSACTPGHAARISRVPTPRAAGSRSRTARTSRRSSPATRATEPIPNISSPRLPGGLAARPATRPPPPPHLGDGRALPVDLEEAVDERLAHPREELQRLGRLE